MHLPGRQSVPLLEVEYEPVSSLAVPLDLFNVAIDGQPKSDDKMEQVIVCQQVTNPNELISNIFRDFRPLPLCECAMAHSVIPGFCFI
jgi:hypothetical protein